MSDAKLVKIGRPTDYNDAMSDRICNLTATTPRGLEIICAAHDDLPSAATVNTWLYKHPAFLEKYLGAKMAQSRLLVDETLELAQSREYFIDSDGNKKVDPGSVAANKLQINNTHWHASRLLPRIFGDRQQVETTTSDNEELKKEIEELRAQLDKDNKKDY